MNEIYGQLYNASRAEAATSEMAGERAKALSNQFVMDMDTRFLRDRRSTMPLLATEDS